MRWAAHRRDWEDLSYLDPYWAILSDPSKQHGGWDAGDVLATGRVEIERLMTKLAALGRPLEHGRALDFGCGAGRLTRGLGAHFDNAVGVDISEQMIVTARELNADVPNVAFEVNAGSDLAALESASFDLAYTQLVLQHLPSQAAILGYAGELVRVLRPGGIAVLQVPSHIPAVRRLQPRPRAYGVLRRLGVPRETLYRRLRLQPIRMRAVALPVMREHLERCGADVVACETEPVAGGLRSTTYYAAR
jgi:SAM-dependent methyltransferase